MFGQYPGVAGESANCTHSNGEIIPCYHMPDLDHWDTNHDYTSQTSAIDSGLMDRFDIKAGTPGGPVESLSQYTRGDLPIYYALIDNYAVDDGFFPLFRRAIRIISLPWLPRPVPPEFIRSSITHSTTSMTVGGLTPA